MSFNVFYKVLFAFYIQKPNDPTYLLPPGLKINDHQSLFFEPRTFKTRTKYAFSVPIKTIKT